MAEQFLLASHCQRPFWSLVKIPQRHHRISRREPNRSSTTVGRLGMVTSDIFLFADLWPYSFVFAWSTPTNVGGLVLFVFTFFIRNSIRLTTIFRSLWIAIDEFLGQSIFSFLYRTWSLITKQRRFPSIVHRTSITDHAQGKNSNSFIDLSWLMIVRFQLTNVLGKKPSENTPSTKLPKIFGRWQTFSVIGPRPPRERHTIDSVSSPR